MKNIQKLELTWVGKDVRPRLEPRILIEDAALSHHAKVQCEGDIFDNILIHDDNLLALRALETDQKFLGKIKCVYIDPPFNTGAAFDHYEDGLEHSVWLSVMYDRIKIIHNLLSNDGSLFVHLDDNEIDYMKIMLDEIFGRENFLNRITVDVRSPSSFSTVNPGVFKASEYILWYAKDKSNFRENRIRVKRSPDYHYNKWIINPKDSYENWKFCSVEDAYYEKSESLKYSKNPKKAITKFDTFIVKNASRICRLASISDSGAGKEIREVKKMSLQKKETIFRLQRENGMDDVYVLGGQQLIFYSNNVLNIDGDLSATRPLTDIWTDIAWEGIANEGGIQFKKGKKPEKLVRRCIELATVPGDIVLDSFAGSGTTGAVAHKMGRRWIMIELGDHARTLIVPRMNRVIDGEDKSGVSKALNWNGGGGYQFYRLAQSLMEKDCWGNWVICRGYNSAMLVEAICKHFGYTYAPSSEKFWMHGFCSEESYIYITTRSMTHEQLCLLSDEVGEHRSLLICCGAFELRKRHEHANLDIRKIPSAILDRCEWQKDDYSLRVESLPRISDEDRDNSPASRRKRMRQNAAVSDLFPEEKCL